MDDVSIDQILETHGISSVDVIAHDGPVEYPHFFPSIKEETALWIDEQLDWEDAVSIAFLIVQKEDIALQLSKCLEGNKCNIINQDDRKKIGIVQVIFLSAVKHQATSWQLRLYEALFLIGYKKVLYDLGIDDEDAEKKFCGGAQLKGDRRLLFTLCQELEMNDQARLLQFFQDQLAQYGQTVLPVSMIESQLLHLLLQKQLMTVFCEFIEKCLQCLQRGDLQQIFLQGPCGKSGCQVHSRNKDSTEEEYYKQGQGLCVIINQKKFYKDRHHPYSQQLDHRLGTDIDRNELEATFLLFGADIIIKDDLTHQEMLDELEIAADKANTHNYAWVTVCVLSHGRRLNGVDEILGCNGVGIDRKKIINTFADASKWRNLHRKPKLFFFQACRGNENQGPNFQAPIASDSAVPEIDGWPNFSDYMVASSTIEDFVSFRSTIDGSFFIRHLCDELQTHGHERSIGDVMTTVIRKVAGHRPDYPEIPECKTTMTKKFQFQRTKQGFINGVEKKLKNGMFYQLQNQFIADRVNQGSQA